MEPAPSINRLLFVAASGFSDPDEQRDFLEFACHGDTARRKRVESLLEARRDAEEFFVFQPALEKTVVAADDGDGGLGARIGPYVLIDRLGAGGCGVVYLAEQQEPVRRKVALKIIRLGMDTDSVVARFAKEREALALMDHPNIARVLDAGATASGRPYFAMELVDGERITEFCDRRRLGVHERLELFICVCEAIQHAHQKGVIHRDIKPSNVLVREQEGRGIPKVIDFGIAKATTAGFDADATFTRSGHFIGTPAYMSPEQAGGGVDIDTRSDIYSLGALLCELLTGQPPHAPEQFKDLGMDDVRALLRDGECARPSALVQGMALPEREKIASDRSADVQRLPSQLAGDLDWIVLKAVAKDRALRYGTANGLSMDLRRFLNEEPVLARPPSRRYLLMKMVRRNRIAVTAGAVALTGLLGGFGVSTWLFLREREARVIQAGLRIQAERARANEVVLRENARAADLVTQAAVLVRYAEMQQADALLATLPVDRIPMSLEAADTLMAVADWNLMQGRWKVAAERFHALVRVITSVDLTDTDRMSRILLPAATAIKEWGEPGQYDGLREQAIERFADTSNPAVAAQVIKAVLLEPADAETMRALAHFSDVLEPALETKEMKNNPYLTGWRQFSLALLAYRQGEEEPAAEWARRSLGSPAANDQLVASNQTLLAMIDARGGQVESAIAELEIARGLLARWQAEPFKIGESVDFWFDWQNVHIFLKEAEAILAESGG